LGTADVSPLINAPGKTILTVLLPLWNKYIAAGLIDFRANTKLVSIQKNGHTISSILVDGKDGLTHLTAHNYVLTTGGYAANPDFFSAFTKHATRLISTANMDSTGDGIIAAKAIGAIFSGADKHSSTLGGIELEPGSGRVNFWNAWARVSNGMDRKQREIYVNDAGERFMNEYDLNVDERERIVLKQSNRRFWLIFNEHGLRDGISVIPQWNADQIIAESKKEKAIWRADSIAELATKTGLPVAALTETIEQYNSFCKQQLDEKFGRTYLDHPIENGPFYAILVYAYSLISFGGIKVNEQLQVLTKGQQTFTNLYAAGEILGAAATSGHAFCGGMLLTPALSFGKWLGEVL
jgi:fumarate reductase flavoprotein subunit